MFPNELTASTEVEAEEIRINDDMIVAAAAFESERVFVTVRNIEPVEGIGNYYFGFGAHSFTAGGVVFGSIRLEYFSIIFLRLPGGGVVTSNAFR